MPLTQGQIDAIGLMMNGDPVDVILRGAQQMLNDLNRERDNINALLLLHEDITDANATMILGKIKTRWKNVAAELVTLLT